MDLVEAQKWAYMPDIPEGIDVARHLLSSYGKIAPEDMDAHLSSIREAAWKICRAPFIGRWRFLFWTPPQDPVYRQVLFRLTLPTSRDALLDLGCGLGQTLRQFRADGVLGSQLFGLDLESRFIDIGYALFQDQRTLGATFVNGDMLDPADRRLDRLDNTISMIHAASFFHLFTWAQQVRIGERLVRFLKPGTKNAVVYGKHAGTSSPVRAAAADGVAYIHDQDSFQRLWDEIGGLTQTRWKVFQDTAGEASSSPLCGIAYPVVFTVHQLS